MEREVQETIVDEGFAAVAEFLGFKAPLLESVRDRVLECVAGEGPLDPDDTFILRWLAKEWGERLVLLRSRDHPGFEVASEPVARLVQLVRATLVARGEETTPNEPQPGVDAPTPPAGMYRVSEHRQSETSAPPP